MYIEFIRIYVGLAVIAVLCIVNIVISIIVLKKTANKSDNNYIKPIGDDSGLIDGAVAYCAKCASPMSTWMKHCPKCGASR